MSKTHWTGQVEFEGKTRSWDFAGTEVVTDRNSHPRNAAPAAIQVTAGRGSQPVPAAVLPPNGLLRDLTQTTPLGLLPAPVRLWLVGLTRLHKNWDGVACVVTQDRSHWIQISADEVVSFQSYLTPTLATSLLPKARYALGPDAMADTLSRPERLATHLSSAMLGEDYGAALGHLLGAELAATRPYWLGQLVSVIGSSDLCVAYETALIQQGAPVSRVVSDQLTQAGLVALYLQISKEAG